MIRHDVRKEKTLLCELDLRHGDGTSQFLGRASAVNLNPANGFLISHEKFKVALDLIRKL